MIACRLRTFAKCQRPTSGDNTEEGWTGMEREPLGIHIHTRAHAYRTQNQPQDVLHSSRHVITGSHDTHFSLKPYIKHSLSVLGLINLAVFVIFMITPVLFIPLDANSPDLSHIHLAVCKQWMIGYSLISRYWIFLHAFVDKRPKAPERTAWFCMHIGKETICCIDWTKLWLDWFCLPILFFLTDKI